MTRIKQLSKRKADMEKMLAEGNPLPEYQAYLPEAEQDPDLAIHYYLRDTIVKLKKLRKEKGISQEEMAEMMGTKQTAISRFETYSGEPGLKFLMRYILALNESPVDYIPPPGCAVLFRREYLSECNLLEYSTLMSKVINLRVKKSANVQVNAKNGLFAIEQSRYKVAFR